ncbi:MAG: hypothetical protein Q9162_001870 [Coniocarpon cinnabarinum]
MLNLVATDVADSDLPRPQMNVATRSYNSDVESPGAHVNARVGTAQEDDDMVAWPDYRKREDDAGDVESEDEMVAWPDYRKRAESVDEEDDMVAWPDYRS